MPSTLVLWLQKKTKIPEHWQGKLNPPTELTNHPVVNVSWHDAQAYAEWANCQLPMEQEWEKAARGIEGWIYPWANEWQANHCNSEEAKIGTTSPVGQFSPQGDSPYGCVDISGNVWEWTGNWYDQKESYRTLRGGAFYYVQRLSCAAFRGYGNPDNWSINVGFRVAEHLSISGS